MGEFVRILFGTLFLFMAASVMLGVGCMGAFAGCVVVVDSVLDPKDSKEQKAAPCPLPPKNQVDQKPKRQTDPIALDKPKPKKARKKKSDRQQANVENDAVKEPEELKPPSILVVPQGFEEDDDGIVRTTGLNGA